MTSVKNSSACAPTYPFDSTSFAIYLIGTTLGYTWRKKLLNQSGFDPYNDKGKGVIYCFWHSHILPLTFIFRNTGKIAVVSESRDGVRAAAVAQRWNHRIIAGSSTRGGSSALRKCVQALNQKENIVVTPDGPRGPREIVKPGIAQIAMLAHAPVVVVKAQPRSCWRLKTWDNFMIPKPFSHIDVTLSHPLIADSDSSENALELFMQRIQDTLAA